MEPQLKSAVTSVGLALVGIFTGYAASSGLIKPEDVPEVTSAVMTVAGVVVAAGIGYYKTRQHTPTALVNAVNSEAIPGVKVVRESSVAPPVVVDGKGKVLTAPPAKLAADAKPELQ